jgi:6-phosphogluconolactonase
MLRIARISLIIALCAATIAAQTLYIGTFTEKGSKGIYKTEFRTGTGELSEAVVAAETHDPSFLIVNRTNTNLYAVNEGSAEVSAFAVDPATGNLSFLNKQPTGGDGPCHLALDATGRMLVVANYAGGSFATFPIETGGAIGPRKQFLQFQGSGPNHDRQAAPHAHEAVFSPDNRFVLINDLGTDRIMVYRADPARAALAPAPRNGVADPGAGPRHLVFGPGNRFVYVLNEMASTVTRFAWDAKSGALKKIDSVSALPPDFHGSNTAAEIAIASNGRTLYTSNRGHDSIAVFQVASGGALRLTQNAAIGGHTPRSFTLDPSGRWLLVANQDSNSITVLRVDAGTGRLTATPKSIQVPSPVCLLFPGAPR